MSDIRTRDFLPEISLRGWLQGAVTGLAGVIATLVALKAASYEPSAHALLPWQDHMARVISFAALAVWTSFAFGLKRKDFAAITTLAFATAVCLAVAPPDSGGIAPLTAANLGIVLAWCSLELARRARPSRDGGDNEAAARD